MVRIALVEDDKSVRDALALGLINRGHAVRTFTDGETALAEIQPADVDVVVLDWMLPGTSGVDVCRVLRERGDIPIVIVTARSDDESIVRGLEAGADDFVVKPAEPRVIEARLHAVLRRAGSALAGDDNGVDSPVIQVGDLVIDATAVTVTKSLARVALTPTEFRLLSTLASHRGKVLSRLQLLEKVWDYNHLGDSRLVDACVQRLRSKIEDDPRHPCYIQTVRGFGYRFGPV